MKPYQIAMAVALVGAGALVLFGDNTPVSDVAEAVVRSAPSAAARAPAQRGGARDTASASETMIVHLQPREQLIGDSGDGAFASNEGVFLSQNWNPPPPKMNASAKAPPPPPPMAPPLPFTYIGKAAADGAWEVYLARADKTYVVRVKTVIDGVYRVETIAPPMMTVTYLPLNQVQQLNIGVLD